MESRWLDEKIMEEYRNWLCMEEKEDATIEKYMRDVGKFYRFVKGRDIEKKLVILYKQYLVESEYAVSSINSMLVATNRLFTYLGWDDCKVKTIKKQKQIYCPADKELTREEYLRLIDIAYEEGNERLALILQTLCATGIRVSELQYITVEAVLQGEAVVCCKGKVRVVFIVSQLRGKLIDYVMRRKIVRGSIFITRTGRPLDRINVWRQMKYISQRANVNPEKVTPHNLRHLFARAFYHSNKDIIKLADVLGHSSINTTRIYVISTGNEHQKCMETLKLVP